MTARRVRRRGAIPALHSCYRPHRDTVLQLLTYLLVAGGFVRLLAAPRLLSALLLSAFMVSAARHLHGHGARLPIVWWRVALATTFLPFVVSCHNGPGPPRFVPLVMGPPRPRAVARGRAWRDRPRALHGIRRPAQAGAGLVVALMLVGDGDCPMRGRGTP